MIEIIKNILPSEINKKIILLLLESNKWRIAKDHNDEIKLLNDLLGPDGKNYGNFLQTYDEYSNINIDTPLNLYAEIIYLIIKKQTTKYKFLKPVRFYWNYYTSSSHTENHIDNDKEYMLSFVYNLHTNNGGTEINGVFYPSNESEAILFPSNIVHKGVTSTNTKGRFNFNCVIELKRVIEITV